LNDQNSQSQDLLETSFLFIEKSKYKSIIVTFERHMSFAYQTTDSIKNN